MNRLMGLLHMWLSITLLFMHKPLVLYKHGALYKVKTQVLTWRTYGRGGKADWWQGQTGEPLQFFQLHIFKLH